MQIQKHRFILLLALTIVLSSTFTYVYAQSQSYSINAYSGVYGYDYTVFRIGNNYYAKSGSTGNIASNTNFYTLYTSIIGINISIFLKRGTYSLSNTLTPANYSKIVGENTFSTILRLQANVNKDMVYYSDGNDLMDFTISDLTLEGNGAYQTVGDGINLVKPSRCIIERVQVQNCKDYGIYLQSYATIARGNHVRNCWVYYSGNNNLRLQSITDVRIYNNVFGWNVLNSNVALAGATQCEVLNNHVGGSGTGGYCIGVSSGSTDNVLIGNVVESGLGEGVGLSGSNRTLINGNSIRSNSMTHEGVYAGLVISNSNNNTITGNQIYDDETPIEQRTGILLTDNSNWNLIAVNSVLSNTSSDGIDETGLTGANNVLEHNIGDT